MLKKLFSIDGRSLALFRIALGIILLVDVIIRLGDLSVFYTDTGVMPRALLIGSFLNPWWWSIHLSSGLAVYQLLLFAIQAILALMLLVGWRTKLASIGSWLMLVSLHNRFPELQQGGDQLLRLLLFWSMFIPLNKKDSAPVYSLGTVGLLLQVAFVYLFAVIAKSKQTWWVEGSGVYYALSIDQFTRPLGYALLQHPAVMKFLSRAVLLWQGFGAVLLFVPWQMGLLRTLAVFGFIAMHMGLNASLALGPFPWVASAAMLVFLPPWFWEKIGPYFSPLFKGESPRLQAEGVGVWGSIVPAAAIILLCWWNISAVYPRVTISSAIRQMSWAIRFDQAWNMFDKPFVADGWYVISGTLVTGRSVDVLRGGLLNWDKPERISLMYHNERWRKFFMTLWQPFMAPVRPYYAAWLCRQWNSGHWGDERLSQLEIFFMHETTLPNSTAQPYPERLAQQRCL